MTIRYQHTQRGTLMIVVLIVATAVLASAAALQPVPLCWVGLILAVGMGGHGRVVLLADRDRRR
jgi:hypothetical protein